MECDYLALVEKRLRERITRVSQPLLTNGCSTLEHYKYITGKKEGLEEAMVIVQQLFKDLNDGRIVDSSNKGSKGAAISERANDRIFY